MPTTPARLETLFAELRSAERTARARLTAGCAEDGAAIDRFLERPIRTAEREAVDALAAIGCALEAELAKNLRRETFDRIGLTCAEAVLANVALRARARFRIYTSEIAEAELQIENAIAAFRRRSARRYIPPMFPIQRLHLDSLRLPEPPEHASEVGEWVDGLRASIRDEIRCCVDAALRRVLASGNERMGVVKTRIDLAEHV